MSDEQIFRALGIAVALVRDGICPDLDAKADAYTAVVIGYAAGRSDFAACARQAVLDHLPVEQRGFPRQQSNRPAFPSVEG